MARASKASSASKKTVTKKASSRTKKASAKKAASQAAATTAGAAKATKTAAKATKTAAKTATKASVAKAPSPTKGTKKAAATGRAAKKGKTTTGAATAGGAKATSGASKKKASSPFGAKFLERQRKLLHIERDTYERQATQLRAEAASLVDDIDPGDVQFDEESGEGDTIAVERNRDLALAAKATEMIEEIDHALSKFESGTYGICEVSGEPIPEERLDAIPWAREKVEYKVGGFGRR